MSTPARQLLTYSFAPGSTFEGQLVGALERVESGGAMRILDGLFVGREPDSGELVAVSLTADGSAGMVGRLLSFRLEDTARRSATQHTLVGATGAMVRSLAESLQPGGAVVVILVEHTWALTLGEAVARIGGRQTLDLLVDANEIGEVPNELLNASRPAPVRP